MPTSKKVPDGSKSRSDTDIGISTLTKQASLKAIRQGFTFNLMVVGRSGLGKSTLVNTLFKSSICEKEPDESGRIPSTTEIRQTSAVIKEGEVTLNLNVTDTPGFGDQVNNENCWNVLSEHIEAQQRKYFEEENSVNRPPVIQDTRIHCCLYFIPPTGHSLSSLDVEVLKRLESVVNIVPVIAKGDTLTLEERAAFKERIRSDLSFHGISLYPPEGEEDEEQKTTNDVIRRMIPFAVVGGLSCHDFMGKRILARRTAWGLVEIENRSHNEFPFLRDMIIRTHMQDLIDVTAKFYYESFRKKWLIVERNGTRT